MLFYIKKPSQNIKINTVLAICFLQNNTYVSNDFLSAEINLSYNIPKEKWHFYFIKAV